MGGGGWPPWAPLVYASADITGSRPELRCISATDDGLSAPGRSAGTTAGQQLRTFMATMQQCVVGEPVIRDAEGLDDVADTQRTL